MVKEPEKPKKSLKSSDRNPKLRNFLFHLLHNPSAAHLIKWSKKSELEFQMTDREGVSKLWGLEKGNREMNYDGMSRSLRNYYKLGIMEKVCGRNFRYKFVRDPWINKKMTAMAQRNFTIDAILGNSRGNGNQNKEERNSPSSSSIASSSSSSE